MKKLYVLFILTEFCENILLQEIFWIHLFLLWKRFGMRYEVDINTTQRVEINIPRVALLNAARLTRNLSDTSSSQLGSNNFLFLHF